MLAEGQHTGMEARVVRRGNGDVNGRGSAFAEHQTRHSEYIDEGRMIVTSTCYLQIEEEREFAIIVYLTPPIVTETLDDWCIQTWVDGRLISGHATPGSKEGDVPEVFIYQMPLKVGKRRMMGNLRFAKLETTDNPEHVRLDIQDSDIGTIHVRIEAGKQLRRCRAYTELHSADVGVADEAKSKRTSSVVRPSIVTDVAKRDKHYGWRSRPDGKYIHEFCFNYRTKAILEILDVIHTAPVPPVAHVHEPDIEPDHGAEEKQEVDLGPGVNVQQELLAEIKAMRKQMATMEKNMKRMQAASSNKRKIVDLTGDDSD